MTIKEIKKELNGTEISSFEFEDVVGINGDYITLSYDGKRIKPTNEQWKILWDEMIYQEFGTTDINTILRNEGII